MMPKAAMAARSSPLLITRNTREAPVWATCSITRALRGVSSIATASASMPVPASNPVAFLAQRPVAWYSANRANPREINPAITRKAATIPIQKFRSMLLARTRGGGPRLEPKEVRRRSRAEKPDCYSENEKLLFLLLLLLFALSSRTAGGGGHNHRLAALVGARAGVNVAGLDVNIRLLAQRGEVSAGGRFKFLGIDGLTNILLDVFQGRNPGSTMTVDLQNDETLLGPDQVCELAAFERKRLFFEFLGQ